MHQNLYSSFRVYFEQTDKTVLMFYMQGFTWWTPNIDELVAYDIVPGVCEARGCHIQAVQLEDTLRKCEQGHELE